MFAWNEAPRRVLEKAGYVLEGRQRNAAVKDGQVVDDLIYATVRDFRPDGGPGRPGVTGRLCNPAPSATSPVLPGHGHCPIVRSHSPISEVP